MKRMFVQLGTPDSLKRQVALPNTGIMCWFTNKSKDVEECKKENRQVCIDILKLKETSMKIQTLT
jgi:hypothetical protein